MPKPSMRSRAELDRFSSHVDGATNFRAAVRYKLHAGVVFHWLDTGGLSRESRGFTRDVSPKGAFVFASDCPPRGTLVEMIIDLPALTGEPRTLCIKADGCILRVDSAGVTGRSSGFAVACQRVTLCGS